MLAQRTRHSLAMPIGLSHTNSTRVQLRYLLFISCFVEYSPNPFASCEFKPFWLKNRAQLSTYLWRTYLQRIFQVFLQLMAFTLYMLAEIVRSSYTGQGDPSELCSRTSLPCCDLKPFSRVISPLESE